MQKESKVPLVFISYCWTSEEHKEWILKLAERLISQSGVDVILDRWHGVIGQDRFLFMEESIERADKVLVICDKNYCEKANNRLGGVGTESQIITPELYRDTKQDKFIPISLVQEKNGDYLLPNFFKSRFALGMINPQNFESDYKVLERLIWQEPELKPPARGERPNFSKNESVSYNQNGNKPKLLYLYAYLAENGIDHIKSMNLINVLKENYDVKLAYGICEDDIYLNIEDASLKKQLISEEEFNNTAFQVMIIENRLGKIGEDKLKTEKFKLNSVNLYIQSGGICIFLLAEDITQHGTSVYNEILKKAGMPLIREARSIQEFPNIHLVDESRLSKYIIYGWDEKFAIDYPRTYKISIDNLYYQSVSRNILPIFKGVNQLIVRSTMQVDVGLGNVLLSANKQTEMLAIGDLMWDGDIRHYIGTYKEVGFGVGILIGSNICSDDLLFMHQTDSIVLMKNTISYFLEVIQSRKNLMV
ncbi:MAG: protein-transrane prediction [Paenibacillus sp.]|jgi:hypothetical protein|nr:protein-transrane prediction [Paenibacillus sp.]